MVHFIPPKQRHLVLRAAQDDQLPVLIRGGLGSGKSGLAKWIHNNSLRSTQSYIIYDFNLPLADQLLKAQGGSLGIHEISRLPLGQQLLLYTFIKTRSIPHTLDPSLALLLNVRIIATTSHDLHSRAENGMFNRELLAELENFYIDMPALTARQDEFGDIVSEILREIAQDLNKGHLRQVSEEGLTLLRNYDWPGNLRELRNILRIATIKAKGDQVEALDLPEFGHHKLEFLETRANFERVYLGQILDSVSWNLNEAAGLTRMPIEELKAKIEKIGLSQISQY